VGGFDEAIPSLYAKGLPTGEIQAHLADVYGAQVSRDLVSKVIDAVVENMTVWRNRPLGRRQFPVIVALVVKVRDGPVAGDRLRTRGHPAGVAVHDLEQIRDASRQ
jgi:putative transposase